MGIFYPQSAMALRVLWENMQKTTDITTAQYDLPVTPKRVEVNINSYREADTFSADLDFKNFPFDPRAMRAVGVTIYMEDMKRLRDEFGQEVRIVPGPSNIVFQGFVDEESIKLDESAGVITLSGRDYTSLLLDRPFITAKGTIPTLDLGLPLDTCIQLLLSALPETRAIKVVNRTGADLPVVAKYAGDYNALAGQKNSERKDKYWEVIQDLVGRAALICYIEIDKLVITNPRALYGETKAKQFIYGKNLKSLEFKRKLGRVKGFNIQVQSLHVEKKQVLIAKIPEQASDAWLASLGIPKEPVKIPRMGAGGQVTQENAPYLTFSVPDITEQSQLIRIGEKTFEEVGRQEIEGTLETKDMIVGEITSNELGYAVGGKSKANKLQVGFGAVVGVEAGITAGQGTFDLLKIRNATPIAVLIDWEDLQAISQETDPGTRYQYLKEHCYSEQVASALATVIGKYPNVFYTRSVKFSMSADDGFSCSIDFINYVRAPKK